MNNIKYIRLKYKTLIGFYLFSNRELIINHNYLYILKYRYRNKRMIIYHIHCLLYFNNKKGFEYVMNNEKDKSLKKFMLESYNRTINQY